MATVIHGYQVKNVTISGANISSDAISEDKLSVSNAPVDGYFLKYTTAAGMSWAEGGGSSPASSSGTLALIAALDTDHTYSGLYTTMSVSTNTVGFGAALRTSSSGTWVLACASSSGTVPCGALALSAGTGNLPVMIQGFVRDDSWNWTIGNSIYISTTSGTLTQTAPSVTGQIVQIIGVAMQTNEIFFNPNYITVEIV
jgi:hypothetical protein